MDDKEKTNDITLFEEVMAINQTTIGPIADELEISEVKLLEFDLYKVEYDVIPANGPISF